MSAGGSMPRYFFHLTDGEIVEPDDVGQPLRDEATALAEARRFLSEIGDDLETPDAAFVRVVDQRGKEVGIVPAPPRTFRKFS